MNILHTIVLTATWISHLNYLTIYKNHFIFVPPQQIDMWPTKRTIPNKRLIHFDGFNIDLSHLFCVQMKFCLCNLVQKYRETLLDF